MIEDLRQELICPSVSLDANSVVPVLEALQGRVQGSSAASRDVYPDTILRFDLSRGLTMAVGEALSTVQKLDLSSGVLFPLSASGDMGYAREGAFVIDQHAVSRIKDLSSKVNWMGFLADPASIVQRVFTSPLQIWRAARDDFSARGVVVDCLGCGFHEDDISALNMIWVYRCLGRLDSTDDIEMLSFIDYASREWMLETAGTDEWFAECLVDDLDTISFDVIERSDTRYLRSLQISCRHKVNVRFRHTLDVLAHTDRDGWKIISQDGQRSPVEGKELARLLKDLTLGARVAVIIDPSDVEWAGVSFGKTKYQIDAPALRPLPYPYHHYLSINSDVDWAPHIHVERGFERFCDELGLSTAGSAYLMSRSSQWPSWQEIDAPTPAGNAIGRWASEGLLDTIHGIAHTIEALTLADGMEIGSEPKTISPKKNVRLRCGDGFLLTTPCLDCMDASPDIRVAFDDGETVALQLCTRYSNPRNNCVYHLYEWPGASETYKSEFAYGLINKIQIGVLNPCVRNASLMRIFAAINTVERTLSLLDAYNLAPPVITSHGGAPDSMLYGGVMTRDWAEKYPNEARMAFDAPDTPYYSLPVLRRRGVHFYNGPNQFSSGELQRGEDLLIPETGRDGTDHYKFCRFYSIRDAEFPQYQAFSYGKHGATAQALATILEDITQRLHWLKAGYGAIIYTHLGHRVGNQISSRLGWTEELHAALARLAEFVQVRDCNDLVPFRLWFAPTASILAFAALMRGVTTNITIKGNEVLIKSWEDSHLGFRIPDPATFGSSWLHGMTVYVPSPEKARVVVDDMEIDHFTINPADELGTRSLTLVDSGRKRALIADPGNVRMKEAGSSIVSVVAPGVTDPCEIILLEGERDIVTEIDLPPIPLRNVTHWTFEVFLNRYEMNWSLGFQTEEGNWYDAGPSGQGYWQFEGGKKNEWSRYTLSFDTAPCSTRPRGNIVALRLSAEGNVNFRDVSILSPTPTQRTCATGRTLAGRVQGCVENVEVDGRTVQCFLDDGTHRSTVVTGKVFRFIDLPLYERCRLEVPDIECRVHFVRGQTAYMTCDQWDWDIVLG